MDNIKRARVENENQIPHAQLNIPKLKRVLADWINVNSDTIEVENKGDDVYVFGSELATLRLLKGFRSDLRCGQGFGMARGKFYFKLEIELALELC